LAKANLDGGHAYVVLHKA